MDVNRWTVVWLLSVAWFIWLGSAASAESSDRTIRLRQVSADPNPNELFDHDIGDTGSRDPTSGQEAAGDRSDSSSSAVEMPGQDVKRDVAELDVFPLVRRSVRNSDLELDEEEMLQRDEQLAKRETATPYPRGKTREEMMGGYIKREIGEGQDWFPPAQDMRFGASRQVLGDPSQRQAVGYYYPEQMPYARAYPFAKRNSYEKQGWLRTGARSGYPDSNARSKSKTDWQVGPQWQMQGRGTLPEEYYRPNLLAYRAYPQPYERRQMSVENYPYQNELPYINKREELFPNYGEEYEKNGALDEREANYEMESAPDFKGDAQMPYYFYSPQEAYVPRSRRLYDPGGFQMERFVSNDPRNDYYPQPYPSQQMYGNQYPINDVVDDQSQVLGNMAEQYALMEPDASLAKREAQLKKGESKQSRTNTKPEMQRLDEIEMDPSPYELYDKRDISGQMYGDTGSRDETEDVSRQRRGTAYEERRARAAFGADPYSDQYYRYPVWKREALKERSAKRVMRFPQMEKRNGLRKRILRNDRLALGFADTRRDQRGISRNRDVLSNPQEDNPDWTMRNSRRSENEVPRVDLRSNRQPPVAEKNHKQPLYDDTNRYRLQDKELLNRDTSYQNGNPSSSSYYSDWVIGQQEHYPSAVRSYRDDEGVIGEQDSGRQSVVSRGISDQEKSRMEWERAQQLRPLNKKMDSKTPGVVKAMKVEMERKNVLTKHRKEGDYRNERYKDVLDEDYPAKMLEEELEDEDKRFNLKSGPGRAKSGHGLSKMDDERPKGKVRGKSWNIEEEEEEKGPGKRYKAQSKNKNEREGQNEEESEKAYQRHHHRQNEARKGENVNDEDYDERNSVNPEELRGMINKREEPDAIAADQSNVIEGVEEDDSDAWREDRSSWNENEDSGERRKKNEDPEYVKTYNNYLKKYEEFARARNQDLDEEMDDESGQEDSSKTIQEKSIGRSSAVATILTSITSKYVLCGLLVLTLAMTTYASSTCFWMRNLVWRVGKKRSPSITQLV